MTPLPTARARRLQAAPYTYDAVGATADGEEVPGFRSLRFEQSVDAGLEQALEHLLTWRMHEGAGIRVRASSTRVAPGVVAVLEPGFGPLRLRAPVRVVAVHAAGFSYGTLPGHPESGEERFDIVQHQDRVVLRVSGFSRPGRLVTRLAGPAAPRLQVHVLARYARSLSH